MMQDGAFTPFAFYDLNRTSSQTRLTKTWTTIDVWNKLGHTSNFSTNNSNIT